MPETETATITAVLAGAIADAEKLTADRAHVAQMLRGIAELPAPTGLDRLIRRDLLAVAELVG